MDMENRRIHRRYEAAIAAEVAVGNAVYEAKTQNISEGGVSAILEETLEEGSVVTLTLILTQDGIEDPNHEPFEIQANVMWAAPSDDGHNVAGLRFQDVSDEQRSRLNRFLSALAE